MSKRFQKDLPDLSAPKLVELFPPLPGWLADRLLRPDEKVIWVRGPRFNPSWERYITHPVLLFWAIIIGVILAGLLRLITGEWSDNPMIEVLTIGASVYVSIIVLGIANGYFTRLVVTNFRLVILQGYEICRSWNINKLPPSLLCYRRQGEQEHWSIDVDAVKSMLGSRSDQFTNAKTILSFGKQLDRITIRDPDRR